MKPVVALSALLLLAACKGGDRQRMQPLLDAPARPDTSEGQRIDEANRLYREGLFDRAGQAIDALVDGGSTHPEALMLKARLLLQRGETEAALPWLDRAAAASPLWGEPRILLAQAYLKLERYSAAETVFADVERIVPKGPWGPYGMAAVAARRGDSQRAIQLVDSALERDPEHQPSLELRAHLARAGGDSAREEVLLGRLVALDPDADQAWARLGALADAAGRREDARRRYERAWALSPQPATARALADLAERRDDAAEAARWRTRAGTPQPSLTGSEPQ